MADASPESAYVVTFGPVVAIRTNAPDPLLRSIRNSVSLPLVSCHARSMRVADAVIAVKPVGATGVGSVPLPVTALDAPPPPLNVTLPLNVPTVVGLKRTVTCCV